jgi:DNA-binding MarR family transcriptional regulator
MAARPPAMDRRLLFLLQRGARAALGHTNRKLLERMDISVAQLAALSYVAERPGCSMTQVADLLDLNKSAVSGMIVRLERAGLLRREPNPHDGRGALLYSTAKGERTRAAARPVFRGVIAEMTDGLAAGELEVVLRFLNALVDRFGSEAAAE